jgi:Tfp pilus assembly protein PilZ
LSTKLALALSADERESPRARLSGVRFTCEHGTGETAEGDALDIGARGVFVKMAAPLAVGKRVVFEIHILGEPAPIAGVGRVAWTREIDESDARPAGMGVTFIDAEEEALRRIARLVSTREPTITGLGAISIVALPAARPRQETLSGVAPAPPMADPFTFKKRGAGLLADIQAAAGGADVKITRESMGSIPFFLVNRKATPDELTEEELRPDLESEVRQRASIPMDANASPPAAIERRAAPRARPPAPRARPQRSVLHAVTMLVFAAMLVALMGNRFVGHRPVRAPAPRAIAASVAAPRHAAPAPAASHTASPKPPPRGRETH